MKRLVLALMFLSLIAITSGCRYTRDASDTLFNETKASRLLQKYEWFKDAHAALAAKLETLKVYEEQIAQIEEIPIENRDRADKSELSQLRREFIGVKSSYNSLAAEYNSQMSKVNYAFTNVGSLPEGATEPLPREYAPYVSE